MSEVMSQNEIDDLLKTLASGGGQTPQQPQMPQQGFAPQQQFPQQPMQQGFAPQQQFPQQQFPQQQQVPQQQQWPGAYQQPQPQQQVFSQVPLTPGFEQSVAPPQFQQLKPPAAAPTPAAPAAPKKNLANRKIKPYDFRRPDKFVKEQLRTINKIYENFSRTVTTSLSSMLRTMVNVQVISVDQITYEEYIRSVPNPSVISVFDVGGDLKGNAVYEMNPSLALAMIDRLFGGPGKTLPKSRSLTNMEETVMKKIIARILNDLSEAWQQFVNIEPKIELIESNPQFTQIAPPTAMVLLVTFEVRIQNTEGTSNLCFPYIVLEPILEKLNVQFLYSGVNKVEAAASTKRIEDSLKKAKIPLVVELGRTRISVNDFLMLNENDVIVLNKHTNELLEVNAGGRLKFKGNPGLLDNNLAVAIAQVIRDNEEVEL